MDIYRRFKNYIRKRLYDEETGFYLNYLTLSISEPKIAREVKLYLGMQYQKIFIPIVLMLAGNYCFNLIQYFIQNVGHPMTLCAGACNQLGMVILYLMIKFKMQEYMVYILVPFILVHATSSLCVYKDWLPNSWKSYPKENFDMQLLANYIYTSAIPTQDFKLTTFVVFPIFFVSSYM